MYYYIYLLLYQSSNFKEKKEEYINIYEYILYIITYVYIYIYIYIFLYIFFLGLQKKIKDSHSAKNKFFCSYIVSCICDFVQRTYIGESCENNTYSDIVSFSFTNEMRINIYAISFIPLQFFWWAFFKSSYCNFSSYLLVRKLE